MAAKKPPPKKPQPSNGVEIPLLPEEDWENEGGYRDGLAMQVDDEKIDPKSLSDKAISYLAQIQDLQEQLQQENLKVERLEMAIRGFTMALQEEIKGLQAPFLLECYCTICIKLIYIVAANICYCR